MFDTPFLRRPAFDISQHEDRLEEYWNLLITSPHLDSSEMPRIPKWLALTHFSQTKDLLFHGSANPHITEFQPRQPNDIDPFSAQNAVYATTDPLWAMFFGIADRTRAKALVNTCFTVLEPADPEPYYYFSVNESAFITPPWQPGTIYILDKAGFVQQPAEKYQGVEILHAQWACLHPVKPMAKLSIEPNDFPFLLDVKAHDPKVLAQRAEADPDGFPWA